MFSEEYVRQIEEAFDKKLLLLNGKKDELITKIGECEEEIQFAVKYLYALMPLSDAASYPFEVFGDYAEHGMYLWKYGPYKGKIPEEIFLNYVLYHRVSSEEIVSCRSFFYEKIHGLVNAESMKSDVLQINYWCAEEAAYQNTDARTAPPTTVYKSGAGRCGEESIFAVTAFRSVGIPARQVFVPRWSHCDDNHAWVEVWCDGAWYFLGACEPEEILNKGWFTNASSRAMMIESRWFDVINPAEGELLKKGRTSSINQLSRYAKTKRIGVKVVEESGEPVTGVRVDFEVLNYAEFYPIASVVTDDNGVAELLTGLGSLHLFVKDKKRHAIGLIDTRQEDCVTLTMVKEAWKMEEWEDVEIYPPLDSPLNPDCLSKEARELGAEKTKAAAKKRKEKIDSFYQGEIKLFQTSEAPLSLEQILKASKGNLQEMIKFLERDSEEQLLDYWKRKLLCSLPEKDYQDLKAEIFEEHCRQALEYKKDFPEDIYISYCLCPRILREPMTAYRGYLKNYFTKEEREEFRKNPKVLWSFIDAKVREMPEIEQENLITSPKGCLEIGAGSFLSKKVLFTAICRSIGIAARLNPVDESMEYYNGSAMVSVLEKTKTDASIVVKGKGEGIDWLYEHNFTIGRLEADGFTSLSMEGVHCPAKGLKIPLMSGIYRVVTSNRLPNGAVFARKFYFSVKAGENKEILLSLKSAKLSDMLEEIPITDFKLTDQKGEKVMASSLDASKKLLMLWLEEGREPTEHILNEMYDQKDEFEKLGAQIYFILKNDTALKDPTINRTLQVYKDVKILYDDFEGNVQTLGRRMYVDPDKLPLILVIAEGLLGIYGTSGYNVGTGDMLLRILKSGN